MYEKFAQLIKERGVTIPEIERRTGLRAWTFCDWKTRGYTPKADKMRRIARALGMTTDEIYDEIGLEEKR